MSSRPALAVSLYVAGKRALVVGDGAAADERCARLEAAGAVVTRVSSADYRPAMCEGVTLVLALDAGTAAHVTRDAHAAGALAYALDQPALSDLALPALVRRGALQIAIATDGDAPALARRLREELERLIADAGPALDDLLVELTRLREDLTAGEARRDRLYQIASRLRLDGVIRIG